MLHILAVFLGVIIILMVGVLFLIFEEHPEETIAVLLLIFFGFAIGMSIINVLN